MSSKLENGKLVIVDSITEIQVAFSCPRLFESTSNFQQVCKNLEDGRAIETFTSNSPNSSGGDKIIHGQIVLTGSGGAMCDYYPNKRQSQFFFCIPMYEFVKLVVEFTLTSLSSSSSSEEKRERKESFNLPLGQHSKEENNLPLGQRSKEENNLPLGQRSKEEKKSSQPSKKPCQHTLINMGQIHKKCDLCFDTTYCPFDYCNTCDTMICQWCHRNEDKSYKDKTKHHKLNGDNINGVDKYDSLLEKMRGYEKANIRLEKELTSLKLDVDLILYRFDDRFDDREYVDTLSYLINEEKYRKDRELMKRILRNY
jgi:hypothetical protein